MIYLVIEIKDKNPYTDILHAFTTKENAQKYIDDKYYNGYMEIEEVDLD